MKAGIEMGRDRKEIKKTVKKIVVGILVVAIICNNFEAIVAFFDKVSFGTVEATFSQKSTNLSKQNTQVEKKESAALEPMVDRTSNISEQESDKTNSTEVITTSGEVPTEVTETPEPTEELTITPELSPEIEEEIIEEEIMADVSELPDDVADLRKNQVYNLYTRADVLKLQELSHNSSLKGFTFQFAQYEKKSNVWDFTAITGFTGFGCEEYPFQGNIQEYYQTGVVFKMNRPMFDYLGSGAKVVNFNITLTNATSGIANCLVLSEEAQVTYSNVKIAGNVLNSSANVNEGAAGAVYGTVTTAGDATAQREIKIDGNGINVTGITKVRGIIAGGYIGQTRGNVKLSVSSGSNVAAAVSAVDVQGSIAGGIVGKLGNGSSFQVLSAITVNNKVGYDADKITVAGISVGGVIGVCDNATVLSEKEVVRDNSVKTGRTYAGGYIGHAINSTVTISDFQLNRVVFAGVYIGGNPEMYAGGVIGKYESTRTDTALTVSNIGIADRVLISAGEQGYADKDNRAGGIAGAIIGDNITITDINSTNATRKFLLRLDRRAYNNQDSENLAQRGTVGGIAGEITGKNVLVSDVSVTFDSTHLISGSSIGGIFGKTGENSRIKLNNITIGDYAIYLQQWNMIPTYAGGIIGKVSEGNLIVLDGTIDVSGMSPYFYNAGGKDAANIVSTKRGYVAGQQTESVIYLEQGAEIKHNDLVNGLETDSTEWDRDYYNKNWGTTLDDVGTYGGIYKNVVDNNDPVIKYDAPQGSEITGSLTYDSTDQTYQINSDADALRLAIALNTFNGQDTEYSLRFAASCFQTGATGKELLSSNYQINSDLDFNTTGIFSLTRSDSTNYEFSGNVKGSIIHTTLLGKDIYPTITLNTISKQSYGGLFTKINGGDTGSVFENFNLDGKMYYLLNGGGLANFASGNLTIRNVNTSIAIRNSSVVYTVSYEPAKYGGLLGMYETGDSKITISDCEIAPEFTNLRTQQMTGGMIGYIKTKNTAVTAENISISNVTVKTQISAGKLFEYGYGNNYYDQVRAGGMIGYIGYDVINNFSNGYGNLGGHYTDATYAIMGLNDITVEDAKMDMSTVVNNKDFIRATGGLLGYNWNNIEVTVDGILKVDNSEINSLGRVGGLITSLVGKLEFQGEVDLDGLAMKNCSSTKWSYSSFLVGDGRMAMITLTADKYKIDKTHVSYTNYDKFDEIVGITYSLQGDYINRNNSDLRGSGTETYAGSGSCDNMGIVNIILPEFSGMTTAGYNSYENQVVTVDNKYTRYYYNLFLTKQETNADTRYAIKYDYQPVVVGTTVVIDSPEDLMLWSLYRNSNSNIKRFLKPYFVNASGSATNVPNKVELTGTLDMKGYSYYPCSGSSQEVSGKNNATIVFYAEDIDAGEKAAHTQTNIQKLTSNANRQHYMMHGGVFASSLKLTVNKTDGDTLTLQGTVANLGNLSGALVVNYLGGNSVINGIVLDGVRLANYKDQAAGLMLSNVVDRITVKDSVNGNKETTIDTDVKVKKITTTQVYDTNTTLAAGALIGQVGSSTAVDYDIRFSDMQIDDRAYVSSGGSDSNHVFRYASFIYNYDSVDNSSINKSFGLYTFTKADADSGNVTYGEEIKDGVGYLDMDADAALQEKIANAAAGKYLPYTYITKDIFVNPRNGNITQGCGTYEDPYIISSAKQLLTLYCYLTGSDAYYGIFSVEDENNKGWTVNKFANGNPEGRCDTTADGHTQVSFETDNTGKVKEEFPTRDELRSAYYKITKDINLSVYQDANDKVMGENFSGIGSSAYPFAGVVIGDKDSTGDKPTITLPKNIESSDVRYWENYGLFQYVKGAVVKNIHIQTLQEAGESQKILISEAGGGVAANVVGGDNIIDSVSVNMGFNVETNTDKAGTVYSSTTMAGAYVGYVKHGSVIIRNMEKSDIEKYDIGYLVNNTRTVVDSQERSNFKKCSRLIGFVADGAVIYEGAVTTGADAYVYEKENFGFTDSFPLSDTFPLINGNRLKDAVATNKITVTGDPDTGFHLTIYNTEQLEVAALALNTDAFAIYNTGSRDTTHVNGYDYTALCRKAQYNAVGCKEQLENKTISEAQKQDYNQAINYDDSYANGYYPYLYQYMDFQGLSATGADEYKTTLAKIAVTQKTETDTTKNITKIVGLLNGETSAALDTESMESAISAKCVLYQGDAVTTYNLYNEAETTPGADATLYNLAAYEGAFRGFGALYEADSNRYSVFKANFDGHGASVTMKMQRDWDATIATTGMFNNLQTYRKADENDSQDLGGFSIKNITILNSTFEGSATATNTTIGAVAGQVKGTWQFENISLKRTAESKDSDGNLVPDISGNMYAGGLIGCINYYRYNDKSDANSSYEPLALSNQEITLINCGVEGNSGSRCVINADNNCGGIIGFVEGYTSRTPYNICTYYGILKLTNCFARYSDVKINANKGAVGGYIGMVGYCYNVADSRTDFNSGWGVSRGTLTITQEENLTEYTLENVTVSNDTSNGNATPVCAGGVVGAIYSIYGNSAYPQYQSTTTVTVNGIKANDIAVISTGNADSVKQGTGGIIGFLWTHKAEIADVSVSNAEIRAELPGTNYSNPAGGLVGRPLTNIMDIYDCQVSDSTIYTKYNGAGGFVGNSEVTNSNTGLIIASKDGGSGNLIKNTTVWSEKYYAGGVVAQQANRQCKKWDFTNISVQGSSIYAGVSSLEEDKMQYAINNLYQSGGIAGYASANVPEVNITDINIGEGSKLAGSYVGGLVAAIEGQKLTLNGDIYVGCKKETDASGTATVKDDTTATVIFGGRYTGGLFGTESVTTTVNSKADIRIHNTKLGGYCMTNSYSAMVGGIAGQKSGNNCVTKYDNFELKDCVIAGRGSQDNPTWILLGGIYGYINQTSKNYFYHPVFTNNSIGYGNEVKNLTALSNLTTDSDEIKLLVGNNGTQSIHSGDASLTITEKTIGKYAFGMGTYFGSNNSSGHTYVLRPELTYDNSFTGNRPVTDCGMTTPSTADTTYDGVYGVGNPYSWRKNVHIIYFEPGADAAQDVITDSNLIIEGEDEYLYGSRETIFQKYKSLGDTSTTKDLLDAYRLNVNMQGDRMLNYYDTCVNRNANKYNNFPVLVIDGKSEQEVLDSVAGMLTNVGGIGSSASSPLSTDVLTVKCQSAKITSDGKIVKNSKQSSVTASNNKLSHTAYYDDAIQETDASGNLVDGKYGYTITLVTYTYGWIGADGTRKSETIYLPVYMVERVSLYSDLRIMEGEQYSMTAAKSNTTAYKGDVYVSNDSSFTLFAEFAYNSTRKKDKYKNRVLKKSLNLKQIDANNKKIDVAYPEGMKFTLVNAATGKAYYYTVPEGNTSTSISFDDFFQGDTVASIGNLTKEQTQYVYNGKTITDTVANGFGLEQYFIYVDNSQAKIPKTAIYYLELSTDDNPEDELAYFDRNQADDIKFIWQPSMSIGFYNVNSENYKDVNGSQEYGYDSDRSTKTDVNGAITNSSSITIDTSFQVKAEQVYWDAKNDISSVFIDSKNSSKYVDIAIYLVDPTTLETLTLPPGTNIIVGDRREPSVDKSVIYTYKDSNIRIPLDDIKSNLGGYNYESNQENRTSFQDSTGQDVYSYRTITLDFTNADLDDYVDVENYTIRLELWRSSDPEYPLGGDRLETYDFSVPCYGKKEEAVSINVDQDKLMNLGINTYQQTTSDYEIPFVTKLDFSGMIKNDKESDIERCANRNYLVSYRILKKVKQSDGTYAYEGVAASDSDTTTVGDALNMQLAIEDGGVGTTVEELTRTQVNGQCVYTMVRKFSKDEIKQGNSSENTKYAVSWGTLLQVDTTNIEAKDYSNYQVEVRVVPFDGTDADYTTNKNNALDSIFAAPDNLLDYSIYNIARIKTTS